MIEKPILGISITQDKKTETMASNVIDKSLSMHDRIIAALISTGKPLHTNEIHELVGGVKQSIYGVTSAMVKAKELKRVETGVYDLTKREVAPQEPKAKAKRDIPPHKPSRALVNQVHGRGGVVRWTEEEKVVLAKGMLDALMQHPLGVELESGVGLYNLAMTFPPVKDNVRHRKITGAAQLKSPGVIKTFSDLFDQLQDRLTAPAVVVNEVISVVETIPMTAEQALAALPTSELLVVLCKLLSGRTAPFLTILDRLEELGRQHVRADTAGTMPQQEMVHRKPKIALICAHHQRRHQYDALKALTGTHLKIKCLTQDNKNVNIGPGYDRVYADASVHSQELIRSHVKTICERHNIAYIKCDDWHQLEDRLRELYATEKMAHPAQT